jgi:hypothetical protein
LHPSEEGILEEGKKLRRIMTMRMALFSTARNISSLAS